MPGPALEVKDMKLQKHWDELAPFHKGPLCIGAIALLAGVTVM